MIKPLPASEGALTLFTTHLAVSNVSHGTIYQQPRLLLILRGIKKRQADVHSKRKRLPITIQLLGKPRHLLSKQPTYDNTTLWAMCCLAFFGFLRVSEFTIPLEGSYDTSRHLSLQDVTVDNRAAPRPLQLILKQSKTDPFKQGVQVYIHSLHDYLSSQSSAILPGKTKQSPRPSFHHQGRKRLDKLHVLRSSPKPYGGTEVKQAPL